MSHSTELAGDTVLEKKQRLLALLLEKERASRTFPLSFAQYRLWLLSQIEPDTSVYNIPRCFRLKGNLSLSALEQSISEIGRRHQILHATFEMVDGHPVQLINAANPIVIQKEDVSDLADAERENILSQLVNAEAQRPFELSVGPLLRINLWRVTSEDHLLLIVMHHIISDGWSMSLFIREFSALYEAFAEGRHSPLDELPIQYTDYALWQRESLNETALGEQVEYWRRQLEGSAPELVLPVDHARPAVTSHRGARYGFQLSKDLSEELQRLSQREGVTLFMTLLAAFQALLWRYSGQTDINVGTPNAGRTRVETENLIGFFVNTLVLRTQVNGAMSFRELLRRVREVCLEAHAHQEAPFERVVEEVASERSLGRTPLFQVMFALHNQLGKGLELPGLRTSSYELEGRTAKFDLFLAMRETEAGLIGSVEYRSELFDKATIKRITRNLETALAAIVRNPEARISELMMMSEEERSLVLEKWNETEADFGPEQRLEELFEQQVARNAGAVAVVSVKAEVSYGELNERANQLAHYLQQRGVGPEVKVGAMIERSVEMVIAVLGVLKAGGTYVPMDPHYPFERLSFMATDAEVSYVLTQQSLIEQSVGLEGVAICVDREAEEIGRASKENPRRITNCDNLAYVIYTSGSTGKPRGVGITHRSAVALVRWSGKEFSGEELSGVLASTSICFDLSVFELFVPLSYGGTVIVAENILQLGELPAAARVRLINTVPSAMGEVLRLGNLPASVCTVNLAGEPLSSGLVKQLYDAPGVNRVYDLYGPSEDTTYSTWSLRSEDGVATIGRPIANTRVYILDAEMRPVPIGAVGEIYLSGAGLARGYLRRPEETAERFLPDPFRGPGGRLYRTGDLGRYLKDGNIEYLGRRDHQVKLRGYRIELGEIESVLGQHESVEHATVLFKNGNSGPGPQLVCYFAGSTSAQELKEWLRSKLPEHMIPAALVKMEKLPLLPNGKIDRCALPDTLPDDAFMRRQDGAPATVVEEMLCGIWAKELGLETIGVDDNFFDLGGHSLLAVRVITRMRQVFHLDDVPLRLLFEKPNVAAIAEVITEKMKTAHRLNSQCIKPAPEGEKPVLSLVQESWLLREWAEELLSVKSRVMNSYFAYRLNGPLNVTALEQSVNEIVRRHESLRTTFSTPKGLMSLRILRPVYPLLFRIRLIRKIMSGRSHSGKRSKVIGDPFPHIARNLVVSVPVIDLREIREQDREHKSRRIIIAAAREPFDYGKGPLIRVVLLRTHEDEHILGVVMSHFVSDGWSVNVFTTELRRLYEAFVNGRKSPLPELPIQYKDYARWQRNWLQGEVLEEMVSYWRKTREKTTPYPQIELPFARKPDTDSNYHRSGKIEEVVLPSDLYKSLKDLSKREGVTLYTVLISALHALLNHYTGLDQVGIFSSLLNRRPETLGLIGWFAQFHAIDADFSDDPRISDLLKQVRESLLGAFEHQEIPYLLLVRRLVNQYPDDYDLPQFNAPWAYFDLKKQSNMTKQMDNVFLTPFDVSHTMQGAPIDAGIEVVGVEENDRLKITLTCPGDKFDAADMKEMLRRYQFLLDGFIANPEARVSELLESLSTKVEAA